MFKKNYILESFSMCAATKSGNHGAATNHSKNVGGGGMFHFMAQHKSSSRQTLSSAQIRKLTLGFIAHVDL